MWLLLPAFAAPSGLHYERGGHDGWVNEIAVNEDLGLVFTGGSDGTVRYWRLDGTPLAVVRLWDATGAGTVQSLALSADGLQLAVGGYFPTDAQDRLSNRVFLLPVLPSEPNVSTIDNLPPTIDSIAFGGPGVVYIGSKLGLFRAEDGQSLSNVSCKGRIKDLEVVDAGLVALCTDGALRLHDPLTLDVRAEVPLPAEPVAACPLGRRKLLVAHKHEPVVTVLRTRDFRHVDTLDAPSGIAGFQAVAASGKALLAGGRPDVLGQTNAAQRQHEGSPMAPLTLGHNSVADLHALSDGRFVFASADGGWGLLDGNGTVTRHGRPIVTRDPVDLVVDEQTLSASVVFASGAALLWRPSGVTATDVPLIEPVPTPRVAFGADLRHPSLDGVPLPIRAGEPMRDAVEVTPGGDIVVAGDWNVYRFDAAGTRVWRADAFNGAAVVRAIADRNLVVVVDIFGRLHWYRLDTGVHLLTVIVDDGEDAQGWLAYSPSGVWTASGPEMAARLGTLGEPIGGVLQTWSPVGQEGFVAPSELQAAVLGP